MLHIHRALLSLFIRLALRQATVLQPATIADILHQVFIPAQTVALVVLLPLVIRGEHLVQVLARQAIAIPVIQAANVTQVLHLIHIVRHVLPELVIQVYKQHILHVRHIAQHTLILKIALNAANLRFLLAETLAENAVH